MKRKVFIALNAVMLLVLLAGSSVYYTYLDLAEVAAKVKARTEVSKTRVVLNKIKVSIPDFRGNDGEIWYHDHLYDIVSYEVEQDSVLVTVHHDVHEEYVVSIIQEAFNTNSQLRNNADGPSVSKHKVCQTDVKCLCNATHFQSIFHEYDVANFPEMSVNHYSIGAPEIAAPPPRRSVIQFS